MPQERQRRLQNGKYEIYVVPTKYFHVDSLPSMSAIYMQFVCQKQQIQQQQMLGSCLDWVS